MPDATGAFALEINLRTGAKRFWTGDGDLIVATDTYTGTNTAPGIVGISDLPATESGRAGGLQVTLATPHQTHPCLLYTSPSPRD